MKTDSRLRQIRGAMALGLILLLFALAIAAVIIAGYRYSTQSQQLERAVEASEQAKKAVVIAQNNRERETLKAVARGQQIEALTSLQRIHYGFSQVREQLPVLMADIEKLRTGDEGRKISLRAPLLRQAEYLFEYTLKKVPSDELLRGKIERAGRLQVQLENAASAEETYLPDAKVLSESTALEAEMRDVERSIQDAKNQIDALTQEARVMVTEMDVKLPQSLDAAITRSKQAEALRISLENAETISRANADAEKTRAETIAREIKANADLESQRRDADVARQREHAEQLSKNESARIETARITNETERTLNVATAQKDDRLRKAGNPALLTKISVFLESGYYQPVGPRSREKEPMSYSKLRSSGALNESEPGLRKLRAIVTSSQNDRTHLSKSYKLSTWWKSEQLRADLIEKQRVLIEFGEALVELGLLAK